MANYSMSNAPGDGARREAPSLSRWAAIACAALILAAVVAAIACSVVAGRSRAEASRDSAAADDAIQQAQALTSGTGGGADATPPAQADASADLVQPALEAAGRVADLQNAYDGASDDDLARISGQLGGLLADDDQAARVPWLQASSLSKGHSGKWEASSFASSGADGAVSLTWLFVDNADGQVLAWATAGFDGYHVRDVEHGMTPVGRDALADNPALDDDLVAKNGS